MVYLLDTHLILWWWDDHVQLPSKARRLIEDPTSVIFVSAASVWEIAIKKSLGQLEMKADIERAIHQSNFQPLSISLRHGLAAGELPRHHDDPFDRMLIAQAQTEGLTFMTHDKRLLIYGSFISLV